jgi:hypothetical protein
MRWQRLAGFVVLASAACTTRTGALSHKSSSPLPPDACATPNTVVTRQTLPRNLLNETDRVAPLGPFAGEWNVHGATMTVRPDGTGTVVESGSPAEWIQLRWLRYRNPDRLVNIVASVSFHYGSDMPGPVPTDACSLADGWSHVGDESVLRVVAPHLLRETILISHIAPANLHGNPYWCGPGLASALQSRCGA